MRLPFLWKGWQRNIGAEGIPRNQASNGLESFGTMRARIRKSYNREPVWDSCADTKGSERRPDAQVAGVCVAKFVLERSMEGDQAAFGEAVNLACQH